MACSRRMANLKERAAVRTQHGTLLLLALRRHRAAPSRAQLGCAAPTKRTQAVWQLCRPAARPEQRGRAPGAGVRHGRGAGGGDPGGRRLAGAAALHVPVRAERAAAAGGGRAAGLRAARALPGRHAAAVPGHAARGAPSGPAQPRARAAWGRAQPCGACWPAGPAAGSPRCVRCGPRLARREACETVGERRRALCWPACQLRMVRERRACRRRCW